MCVVIFKNTMSDPNLGPDELAFFQGPDGAPPALVTRAVMTAAGVTLRPHEHVTYAVLHPEQSEFNLANDAAYDPELTPSAPKPSTRRA